jgi:hypothetical protein
MVLRRTSATACGEGSCRVVIHVGVHNRGRQDDRWLRDTCIESEIANMLPPQLVLRLRAVGARRSPWDCAVAVDAGSDISAAYGRLRREVFSFGRKLRFTSPRQPGDSSDRILARRPAPLVSRTPAAWRPERWSTNSEQGDGRFDFGVVMNWRRNRLQFQR